VFVNYPTPCTCGKDCDLTIDGAGVDVEPVDLDGLVVGARGDKVAHRAPRGAVNGALVVLVLLGEDTGRVGGVVWPGADEQ